jgi:hypothetical protein
MLAQTGTKRVGAARSMIFHLSQRNALVVILILGIFPMCSTASAQIEIFGMISKDTDTNANKIREYYTLTTFTIGNRRASTKALSFLAIVTECEYNSLPPGTFPKWDVAVFLKSNLARRYYYEEEQISNQSVGATIEELSKQAQSLNQEAKPHTLTVEPGKSLGIPSFDIKCIPTVSDDKPSRVRLRFFDGKPLQEVLTTAWTALPNINTLSPVQQGNGPQFRFPPTDMR